MTVSVAYYFAMSSSLISPASEIASAGAAIGAILIGWLFGPWYASADGERPTFELVVVPLLVPLLSLVLGLTILTAYAVALGLEEPRPTESLGDVVLGLGAILFFGFYAFLSVAWPPVLLCFTLAGVWLARQGVHAPNYSLKRTNQSLRD